MTEEAKTLEELVEMFGRCMPQIDKFVDTIIVNNPDVTTPDGGVYIDKIVAVVVMEFLCAAFGKPRYIRDYKN